MGLIVVMSGTRGVDSPGLIKKEGINMASLAVVKGKNGTSRHLWFINPLSGGGRKRVVLGCIPKKEAEAVKIRVEYLIASIKTGQPIDSMTAEWVASINRRAAS